MKPTKSICLMLLLLPVAIAAAQTGKLTGLVTNAETGTPIPGVHVALESTLQGAVTDRDGYYVVLNVRPGSYTIRASFVGYTTVVTREVEVFVDLTTTIDIELSEEVLAGEEVVVTAARPVIQRDVSASIANLSAAQIENLPVTDLEQIVGLQAGFEPEMIIRGFGGAQVQFMVDGLSMSSGFHNEPYTGVSYTAVQEIQLQTGGFNAEYGNARSGLINVVTREPARDRYAFDVIARYSPVSPSAFAGTDVDGRRVSRPDSRWTFDLRPMFDPEVAMEGVNAWPTWKRVEYRNWGGWNAIAANYNLTHGTSFTGAELQSVFEQHYLRKDMEITRPDYEVDATVTGPVPGIGPMLGDLRFLASYRRVQQAYPLAGNLRDAFTEQIAQGKLISNVAPGMKLILQGLYAADVGLNRTEAGRAVLTGGVGHYPWQGSLRSMYSTIGNPLENSNLGELFSNTLFHLTDVDRWMLGARFTHTLDARTFYEIQLQSLSTAYFTRTGGIRDVNDRSFSYLDGQIMLDAAPFGYTHTTGGDEIGVGMITSRYGRFHDNSRVRHVTGGFDLTHQANRYSLLKAGAEYIYSDYDVDFGAAAVAVEDIEFLWDWRRRPQQAAAYAQAKLEFQGMIANLGARLDYFHAGGDWYVYDNFDRAFSIFLGIDRIDDPGVLDKEPIASLVALSPRLGVSFPVTEKHKLYFNYGHFRSRPDPLGLFAIEQNQSGAVTAVGVPDNPMPKTVAYELGFEQNLFDRFHLRLAGYYRDLSKDPRTVRFIGVDDLVDYLTVRPWAYADVRGFEATMTKRSGAWVRGFVNYTYMARQTGFFGFSQFDENEQAMADFIASSTEHYVSKPTPEPYARVNLNVLLPEDLGPRAGGLYPLGDWRISFLGEWRRGQTLTWDGLNLGAATGGSTNPGIQGNVRWRDFYMLDLRLSKHFDTNLGSAQFFVDFRNVLNLRHMYLSGNRAFFPGGFDEQRYMQSLHLPEDVFPEGFGGDYPRIYGDDQPGDYRKPGTPYVPIFVGPLPPAGDGTRPLFYVPDGDAYYQWDGAAFVDADAAYVARVLDDKSYINMPNRTWGTFLNPRNVFFGLRISF